MAGQDEDSELRSDGEEERANILQEDDIVIQGDSRSDFDGENRDLEKIKQNTDRSTISF